MDVTKTEVAEVTKLAETAKLSEVIAAVNGLIEKANAKRDRGPDSQRDMTDDDARRVIGGDLKAMSHRKAAEALGLSYGQVYSARLQFTYKPISKELGAWKDPNKTK